MAKGKVEYWLTSDGLTLLNGWTREGLTDEQIATDKIGISRSTLSEWKKKYSDISDALKKGKEIVDYEVENVLLEQAKSGNVTAIIYWLKNRKPNKWRDRPNELLTQENHLTEKDLYVKALNNKAIEVWDDVNEE